MRWSRGCAAGSAIERVAEVVDALLPRPHLAAGRTGEAFPRRIAQRRAAVGAPEERSRRACLRRCPQADEDAGAPLPPASRRLGQRVEAGEEACGEEPLEPGDAEVGDGAHGLASQTGCFDLPPNPPRMEVEVEFDELDRRFVEGGPGLAAQEIASQGLQVVLAGELQDEDASEARISATFRMTAPASAAWCSVRIIVTVSKVAAEKGRW